MIKTDGKPHLSSRYLNASGFPNFVVEVDELLEKYRSRRLEWIEAHCERGKIGISADA